MARATESLPKIALDTMCIHFVSIDNTMKASLRPQAKNPDLGVPRNNPKEQLGLQFGKGKA